MGLWPYRRKTGGIREALQRVKMVSGRKIAVELPHFLVIINYIYLKNKVRDRLTTYEANSLKRTSEAKRNAAAWIVCTVILLSTIPDMSYAFKQTDIDKLLATQQCQWCDLRNADLSDAQLSGAQIANANLSGANLSGADFSGADFSGAVMSGANLRKANLSGAFLRGSKLQNADLSGADMSKARLNNANLLDANLSDTNFSGANLSGATWKDGIKCDDDTIERCTRATSPSNRGSLGGGIPF